MSGEHRIYLGMPSYGKQTNSAGRAFWRACRDMRNVVNDDKSGSLLAHNFNQIWCNALNVVHGGGRIDYFAMIHDDIGAEDFWLDKAIDELNRTDLDLLGVAVAIKDSRGLTSLALHNGPIETRVAEFSAWLESCGVDAALLNPDQRSKLLAAFSVWINRTDGANWRPFCRLSMRDIFELPETFTSKDLGRPLLLNTGLWVCRFDMAWATKVHFEINNRIAFDQKNNLFHSQTEPEDWFFSRLCHELGLKIGATRTIKAMHRGEVDFSNTTPWGRKAWDDEYTDKSPIAGAFPCDIDGWLLPEEGKALSDLARGKRVLEIGSYCGRSTVCLARTADHVTAVDYFDGRGTDELKDTLPAFQKNLARHGVDHKVTTFHPEASIPLPEYDLVFIDGAHDFESVWADIERAFRVLKPDGLLAFHDYREYPGESDGRWDEGVTKAVRQLIKEGAEIISKTGSLAVVRLAASLLEV